MPYTKEQLKRKLRRSTDQKDPFERPEESERARKIRERLEGKSKKEASVEEMNEARKKWLREKAKRKS